MLKPAHLLTLNDSFLREPVFVLTSDQDWASADCVDALMDFVRVRNITPTLFVTNENAAVGALKKTGDAELGIHPNFLPNTTHGATTEDIIDHVMGIVSVPIATRSHCFYEHSHALAVQVERGLRIDSNLCLFMQPDIKPLQRFSGLTCLPCFWEDDCHWTRGFDWNFRHYQHHFFTPGLKIINVHPFFHALNIPDADFYAQHKAYIPTLTKERAATLRFKGAGSATFLAEMTEAVEKEGLRFWSLSEVIEQLDIQWTAAA